MLSSKARLFLAGGGGSAVLALSAATATGEPTTSTLGRGLEDKVSAPISVDDHATTTTRIGGTTRHALSWPSVARLTVAMACFLWVGGTKILFPPTHSALHH